MAYFNKIAFMCLAITHAVISWEALPSIPTGRRSEYYVLHDNGGYKYGYDTGDGIAAKQAGDPSNQVEGHYFYTSPTGKKLDMKYTAGIQGFVPEGLEKIKNSLVDNVAQTGISNFEHYTKEKTQPNDKEDQSNTGDSSYSFSIDTNTYKREENADSNGNVQGSYSYMNDAGTHDLKYIAGSSTGFLALSGSLSKPNGLLASGYSPINKGTSSAVVPSSYVNNLNGDGSYSFGFSTDEQTRQESSDSSGNVKGSYSYKNDVGNHDLNYVAGSGLGFQITGGSLANPNGLRTKSATLQNLVSNGEASDQSSTLNSDGSYSFSFSTADQARNEKSDSSGNVEGTYSYRNNAGNHDLSYVAGANTGFQVTGGSLSAPNGLGNVDNNFQKSTNLAPHTTHADTRPDGSYSFGFSTDDQSRNEQADSHGNVQGSYSFRNTAGTHDLSYIAGSSTGFQVTGGSLAAPPLTSTKSQEYSPSSDDQANTNDASYNFNIDTDEYQREESADRNGNIKGSFSYKNAVGRHDLNYIAGSKTGFLATGGSLSVPNGLNPVNTPYIPAGQSDSLNFGKNLQNSGDASYTFNIDTEDYKRQESSDNRGNVQGNFSYKNNAGTHDLSYIAGSNTGFQATGGSLSVPPGLVLPQLDYATLPGPYSSSANAPPTKTAYSIGNLVVRTYLPPSNEKQKFGYILDTKH